MIKLALHSVSYSGTWGGQTVLPIEKIIPKAKEFGYDGIELVAKRPHLSPLDYDEARCKGVRDLVEKNQLEIAALAGYNDFANPQADKREKELYVLKAIIEMARYLGVKVVRCFASGMGTMYADASFDQQWIWVREGLKEAAECAAKNEVILGLQNHSPLMSSYLNVLDMVQEVGSDHLKVTLDAPLLAEVREPVEKAVDDVGSLMVHSHTSDFSRRPGPVTRVPGGVILPEGWRAVPLGEGVVDLKGFVKKLKEVGYDGYLSYEICGPVRGGGGEENLDKFSKEALKYMRGLTK
jgi:sugar phosphate isomerase/epimerase